MESKKIIDAIETFYSKNKNKLLSPEAILKITKKFYSFSPFGTLKRKEVRTLLDKGDVIFGFRCGLIICKTDAHSFEIRGVETNNYNFSFNRLIANINNDPKPFSNNFIKTSPNLLKSFASSLYNALKDFEENPDTEKYKRRIEKIEVLQKQIELSSKINVPEINEFPILIKEVESSIIEIGGEEKLYAFLKVKNFLEDFRDKVVTDVKTIVNIDLTEVTDVIKKDEREKSLVDIANHYSAIARGGGLQSKLDKLFTIGDTIKYSLEAEALTLSLYKSLAEAMVIFYVTNKKIEFFDLYSAFEKLGAFNSAWQNEVALKLTSIDDRLASMNNELVQLNKQFESIVRNTDDILKEVKNGFKEINSSLNLNNLLVGITAYQTFRINKNTKQ